MYLADASCTATGTTTMFWCVDCETAAKLPDDVSPPIDAFAMNAFPPSPPLPLSRLTDFAEPPTDTAPEPAEESALPLSALTVFDLLAETATPSSPAPVVAAPAVEADVGAEAPPVAVEPAVLVAAPPAPPVVVLVFEPAPPAPPARLTDVVLVAELVCVNVLVSVLVLLPEFVADEEFD